MENALILYQIITPNFFKKTYRDQYGEFECGYRGLSVIVRKNRAIAKDRGRPFTFMFSQYDSYLKRLTTMAFGEVAVRFSSRYHYFEILGPPAT